MGAILPGGPYVFLPLIASIYKAGAGVGPVIAFLTGRALLGIHILVVWQIPFLGMEIPLARYIVCLFIPPIVGLVGATIFRTITRLSHTSGTDDIDINAIETQDKHGKSFKNSEED